MFTIYLQASLNSVGDMFNTIPGTKFRLGRAESPDQFFKFASMGK